MMEGEREARADIMSQCFQRVREAERICQATHADWRSTGRAKHDANAFYERREAELRQAQGAMQEHDDYEPGQYCLAGHRMHDGICQQCDQAVL